MATRDHRGVTTHFNFFYDPSLGGAGGIEPARINQLLAGGKPVIENDFDWLQAQFAGVDMTKARNFPIPVQVTAVKEPGYNASWGWPVVMNAGTNPATLLRSMFISEVVVRRVNKASRISFAFHEPDACDCLKRVGSDRSYRHAAQHWPVAGHRLGTAILRRSKNRNARSEAAIPES